MSPLTWAFLVAVLGTAAVVSTACAGDALPAPSAEAELGRQIFEDRGGPECRDCHSLDGTEAKGPTFLGLADVAGDRVPGMSAAEYLYQSIVEPRAFMVLPGTWPENPEAEMPTAYGVLFNESQLDGLVAFVLELDRMLAKSNQSTTD